jgi:hypothetical protein
MYGNIMDIYLNYDFISTILEENTKDGNITLFKFLTSICDGINNSLGNFNKLEPIIQDDNVIKIIDQNPIPGIQLSTYFGCRFINNPTPFEIYGYNYGDYTKIQSNFVRDFGFRTKIGPELASMITIGATAANLDSKNYDGTAFSKWNDGLQDAYAITYDDPNDVDLNITASNPSYPLTKENLVAMSAHWKDDTKCTVDESYLPDWVDFLDVFSRSQAETKIYGIANIGTKDVDDCPITHRDYENVTWVEYVMEAKSALTKQLKNNIQKDAEKPRSLDNYVGWLIQAFAGNINGTFNGSTFYFYFNDDFYKIGKELFKGFINSINNEVYTKSKTPSNTIGFIPADLSLTIDGLSGIKIYNALSINQRFLPKQYPLALNFIITKVNHDISNNNWGTSLNTIAVPKTATFDPSFLKVSVSNVIASSILDINASSKITGAEKISNIEIIATYLKSIGITQEGATGLIGNILGESQANPKAAEKNINVGGLGGIGIVQWTNVRRRTLEKALGNDNAKILDLNNQLNFLKGELETNYRTVFNQLKSSTSIADSTIIVLEKFEVPATYLNRNTDPNAYIATQQRRIAYANGAKEIVAKVYQPKPTYNPYPTGPKY